MRIAAHDEHAITGAVINNAVSIRCGRDAAQDRMRLHIENLYGPGAAIFTAVSVAVLLTYKLNKAKYAQIQSELVSRRAAKAAD